MKPRHVLTFVLLGLVLFANTAPLQAKEIVRPILAAQQTSDAPYLMAFSNDNAPHFVIERADGTDSRVFAADVMPPDTNHVDGAGWSPSGQWFAWTANALEKFSNTGDRPFVLSADGQTRLTVLDDMNRAEMAWSPTEDILFVAGLVNMELQLDVTVEETHDVTVRMGLIDPATDTWRSVTETTLTYDNYTILYGDYLLGWLPNGSMAYSTMLPMDAESPTLPILTYFMADGAFAQYPYDPNNLPIGADEFGIITAVFSPYGEFINLATPTTLQLIGAGTKDVTIPASNSLIGGWWSPDGQKLLVQSEAADGSGSHDLWVWSRADNTITPLLAQAGLTAPFTLANISTSPDFSRVFFIAQSSAGNAAHVVNLDGSQPMTFAETPVLEVPPIWNNTGQIGFAQVSSETETTFEAPFGLYDIAGDSPVALGEVTVETTFLPSLAPGGLVVAHVWESVFLKTLATDQTIVIPPDSRRFITLNYGEVKWHPSQAWAFLWEDALVAGGGYMVYTRVINESGTIVRPLGYCENPTRICVDWLPPQVSLAPGTDNILPVPVVTLPTGLWLNDVIWSPDGTQIAFADANRMWGEPTPFEVRSIAGGESVAVFEGVGPNETVGWVGGQPQLVSNELAVDASQRPALAVSPDGSRRLGYTIMDEFYNMGVEMYDAEGNLLWSSGPKVVTDFHLSASFSPDGQLVAVSSAHADVTILDVNTGAIVGGLPLINSNAIAFSPDGTQLAVAEAMVINIYSVADLLN